MTGSSYLDKRADVERYGRSFSERRPLLHPDGRFEMSKGLLPRQKRRQS